MRVLPACLSQEGKLMIGFRHAAIAAALLASAGVASAQTTTMITREPVETRTVVRQERLELTPVQRETIYRTIIHEHAAAPPPPTVVPSGVRLYRVPRSVAVEVPAVKAYKYMVVNGEVVLVDPATSQVVAQLSR